MAAKNNNVVKFRVPFRPNIGLGIFLFIFIYLIIIIVKAFQAEAISVYEVQKSYIDNNIYFTAIASREETLINTMDSGYISYYIRDGEKVARNATVYTVDETGSVYDVLSEAAEQSSLSNENYTEIKNRISMFQTYFDDNNYGDVYDFKYDLENIVLELSNELLIEQLTTMDASNLSSTFKKIASEQSGIVTYYQDGYENFTLENATADSFNKENYEKVTLKTGEIISSGSPVYKMITSEEWHLIGMLSKEEAESLAEKEVVKILIGNSNNPVNCNFLIQEKEDGYYIDITLNKLMINYIDERFIDVEIVFDQNQGLKIPNTAIVEKEVLMIPIQYLTTGSNSTAAKYFNVNTLDETGNITVVQESPTIYKTDEAYCYVDPNSLDENAILIANDTGETLNVSTAQRTTLLGVYSANKGTALFKQINILQQKDEFCIVEEGLDYGISMYDYIILDASNITENQIIYK